ncbi:hypothetical protein CVT25_000277 [Psilocybe cyanescens]|uniref:Uncharacterized protein n=1 Tax=Psilocybe cyanescens TaxID=93625 RepID=A0A409XM95_PSICY|nr:hypothetical protein CVT25_000277 [Psilocybe cyanescens]
MPRRLLRPRMAISSGATIVQVIATNAAGAPSTTVIQTLTSSSPSPSPVSSTSSDLVGALGPKNGQPVSQTGTPGAPTPYLYTTVIDGSTQVFAGTFTPTSPQTVNVSLTQQGTILAFSSWLAVYGPPTGAPQNSGIAMHPASALVLLTIVVIPYWIGIL